MPQASQNNFEVNPFGLGGSSWETNPDGVYSSVRGLLVSKFKQYGKENGLTMQQILGSDTSDPRYGNTMRVVEEFIKPTDPLRQPLLEMRQDNKIYPTQNFGILSDRSEGTSEKQ